MVVVRAATARFLAELAVVACLNGIEALGRAGRVGPKSGDEREVLGHHSTSLSQAGASSDGERRESRSPARSPAQSLEFSSFWERDERGERVSLLL
jgi:hypothetical protein